MKRELFLCVSAICVLLMASVSSHALATRSSFPVQEEHVLGDVLNQGELEKLKGWIPTLLRLQYAAPEIPVTALLDDHSKAAMVRN